MIRRRDGEWLPFWRDPDGWVVSVEYRTTDGGHGIGRTRASRWRLVALWRGMRGKVR